MIETIARLYDSHEKALAAGQALVDAGFAGEQIALLSAMRILNGFGPISLHQADPEPPARPVPSYDATPLSRIFNLPVLIDSPSRPIDVAIDVAPLSQALRLPLLLKEPAPLSRLLRVPALTDLF